MMEMSVVELMEVDLPAVMMMVGIFFCWWSWIGDDGGNEADNEDMTFTRPIEDGVIRFYDIAQVAALTDNYQHMVFPILIPNMHVFRVEPRRTLNPIHPIAYELSGWLGWFRGRFLISGRRVGRFHYWRQREVCTASSICIEFDVHYFPSMIVSR